MRAVAGIVVGLVVAFISAVLVGIVAFGATFSPPPGTDATDLREVARVFMAVPQATLVALAAAWSVGAFVGALVAKLIARRAWVAWAIALAVAAYFGFNAFALLMPFWVQVLWIVGPLVGGLLANMLVRGGVAPAAVTPEAAAVEAGDDPAGL
jgi:hypothetical protein